MIKDKKAYLLGTPEQFVNVVVEKVGDEGSWSIIMGSDVNAYVSQTMSDLYRTMVFCKKEVEM
jgi:hypothetical protein